MTRADASQAYLEELYCQSEEQLACQQKNAAERADWQQQTRAKLWTLLRLDTIAAANQDHEPTVVLGACEELDGYTRQYGQLQTESTVSLPFWYFKPQGEGPFPLALLPHGHDPRGYDTTAGVWHDEAHREKIAAEDRDTAIQAVTRGYSAIAPATRGLAGFVIPDSRKRHGDRPCRSHLMHCLAVDRTAMGERVWDMQRFLDWALSRSDVDAAQPVLMMGNSGGGVVTLFTSACDTRVGIAVPSCSFAPTINPSGHLFHCDCNMVPGLLELGGMPCVAGLIAPRPLLIVNGRTDRLFAPADVERGVEHVRRFYELSGRPDVFSHRWGQAGHRFYKDLMWPFIASVQDTLSEQR